MNSFRDNSVGGIGGSGGFEESLRVIARLPAPEGMEERVIAGVRAGSGQRRARLLEFPAALRPGSNWMRGAAAAAIVFVVAGGGWGVYSRVQMPQAARVIAMPARVAAPGGFSNAGAMRTPNTLTGPAVPLQVTPAEAQTIQAQTGAKAQTAKKANRRSTPTSANKAAVQPVAAAK
jgi:hypothetical protein